MNDKQRAEFEEWLGSYSVKTLIPDLNAYADPTTDALWQAWQAAISSVVVELPTLIIDECENGETLEYVEMSELKESLDKAGIRYE